MNLDTTRLNKLKRIGDGYQAQCPACWTDYGQDKSGNHLRIFPDGKYGCAMYQGDHEHRSRIWELCGLPLDQRPVPQFVRREEPQYVNCTELVRKWGEMTDWDGIRKHADSLGVAPLALRCLGTVWSGEHWATPMKDKFGSICGIQFRYQDGFKQTLKNCRVGYFIPECPPQRLAIVTEGASDCAAALTLGLYAVGRYNCAQNGTGLGQYLRSRGVRDVVVCADNDQAGIAGAEKLAGELHMRCCIYTPPTKDLRSGIQVGLTRSLIESTVSSLVWRNA